MTPLGQRLDESLRRHVGPQVGAGIIAISGGPDSVALAFLAKQLVESNALPKVVLAHLNHQLRGSESDADEAFVNQLAAEWNVPAVTESIDVADLAQGRNLEATARDLRYAWLTQTARAHGAAWIATGHTADDQAETVLHHFLRGSGLAGLSGIAHVRSLANDVALVRPLLNTRRAELLALLEAAKIDFRVDVSNDDRRFTRNRLRHEIMPLLESAINPAVCETLTRTAEQASECQRAVTVVAEQYLKQAEKPRAADVVVLARSALAELAPFWIREVFRLVWQRERWPMGEMDANDWRRLETLVDGSRIAHDFPGGVQARGQRHVVQLRRSRVG